MANPMYGQNKFDNTLNVKGRLNKASGIPVQDDSGIAPVGGLIMPPHVTTGFWNGAVSSGAGHNFADADPYSESSTKLFPLGTRLDYGDRVFRYAKMNGAVTAGKLLQGGPLGDVHATNHTDMNATAQTAVTTSDTSDISVETVGTDMTANMYEDGYLWVNDADGEGQSWRVKSNPAHTHSSDPSVVITVYGKINFQLETTSELSIVRNPYLDVIVAPTAETSAIVGVTNINMTDDYFGWIQTRGPKACLAGETLVLGHRVLRSDTDAGAVMPDNSDDLTPQVGQVMGSSVVDAEYALIYLTIE